MASTAARTTMRAAVCGAYGPPDTVRVVEVPKPQPVGDQVLVRVAATTVSTGDSRIRAARFPRGFGFLGRLALGITGPRRSTLGADLAGVVEAVGPAVQQFRPGDEVIAAVGVGMGCHAEYRVLSEKDAIVRKPPSMAWDEAAAIPFGGLTALVFLRDRARVAAGERVLVIGASGAVGSAAVQIARAFGATVTAVCSQANHELVRSLGATDAIDYNVQDFAATPQKWDVIVDTTGTVDYARCRRVMADGGRLALVVGDLWQTISAGWTGRRAHHTVLAGPVSDTAENLEAIVRMAADGTFRPVIDSRYNLDQIAQAHARTDSNHKRGSVVVQVWTP